MRLGSLNRKTIRLIILTLVLAPPALGLWYGLSRPEMERYTRMVPTMPVWMLPLAGLGFAAVNAAIEEITFRGIILQALDKALGTGLVPLVLQGGLFGLLHYHEGFPNGLWGVGPTFCYGFMPGLIRRRSHGMPAPWLVHAGADMVVFIIIAIFMYTSS